MLLFLAGIAVSGVAAAGSTVTLPFSGSHLAPVPLDEPASGAKTAMMIEPGSRAFGLIGDAVMGEGGRSFLLDVMERQIGVAERGGSVAWTGSGGRGPGEFLVPVALALHTDVLYVLDRGNRRIERYRTATAGLRRDGGVPLEFDPEDLCVSRGRMFVLGAYGGYAIHEVSPRDGRVLRSLAPDPQLDNDLLATFRASGYLACGEDELTFLPLLRPEVLRFSAETGALLGRVPLPDYNAVHIQTAANGIEFRAEGGTHDVGASVLAVGDGRALVQVGALRQGTATVHEFTSVCSYLVDWRMASARVLSGTLPRIADLREGWALALETDPEPSARRIRFTPPPDPTP